MRAERGEQTQPCTEQFGEEKCDAENTIRSFLWTMCRARIKRTASRAGNLLFRSTAACDLSIGKCDQRLFFLKHNRTVPK
jgi:hypothetical protein